MEHFTQPCQPREITLRQLRMIARAFLQFKKEGYDYSFPIIAGS